MKITIITILVFCIISCSNQKLRTKNSDLNDNNQTSQRHTFISNEDEYELTNERFSGKREVAEILYNNNKIKAKGNYAISKNGRSELKIGNWMSYYEDGAVMEKGKYEIGRYIHCCFDGPCMMFYNYKMGDWEYYNQNGNLEAKGTYDLIPFFIETTCKGGDSLIFGVTNSNWEFYNKEGSIILPTDSIRLNFEKVENNSFGRVYLFPDKRRNKIEMESIK
jgi:antitoxin component YwqK of YwqJK toxin-antitoxin module